MMRECETCPLREQLLAYKKVFDLLWENMRRLADMAVEARK